MEIYRRKCILKVPIHKLDVENLRPQIFSPGQNLKEYGGKKSENRYRLFEALDFKIDQKTLFSFFFSNH